MGVCLCTVPCICGVGWMALSDEPVAPDGKALRLRGAAGASDGAGPGERVRAAVAYHTGGGCCGTIIVVRLGEADAGAAKNGRLLDFASHVSCCPERTPRQRAPKRCRRCLRWSWRTARRRNQRLALVLMLTSVLAVLFSSRCWCKKTWIYLEGNTRNGIVCTRRDGWAHSRPLPFVGRGVERSSAACESLSHLPR